MRKNIKAMAMSIALILALRGNKVDEEQLSLEAYVDTTNNMG